MPAARSQANWVQPSPATTPPGRIASPLVYDPVHQQIVIFGGNPGGSQLSDTWVWDGTKWTRISPATSPPARYYHCAGYDPQQQRVVLFGGFNSSLAVLNDTWVWDGANWTQKSPSQSPAARICGALAYDELHNQMVLFGGQNRSVTYTDTWTWDGTNRSQLSPATVPPNFSGRRRHPRFPDSQQLLQPACHRAGVLFQHDGGSTRIGAVP